MTIRWLLRIVTPIAVASGVVGVLLLDDHDVNLMYLAGITIAATALLWLAIDLLAAVPYTEWDTGASYQPPQAGTDIRLSRMTERLMSSVHRDTVGLEVHRILRGVVDDRLGRSYGIDRLREPQRAAAILGPELTAYLEDAASSARLRHPERLAGILARIEAL